VGSGVAATVEGAFELPVALAVVVGDPVARTVKDGWITAVGKEVVIVCTGVGTAVVGCGV
jgi:hypothetical protein